MPDEEEKVPDTLPSPAPTPSTGPKTRPSSPTAIRIDDILKEARKQAGLPEESDKDG